MDKFNHHCAGFYPWSVSHRPEHLVGETPTGGVKQILSYFRNTSCLRLKQVKHWLIDKDGTSSAADSIDSFPPVLPVYYCSYYPGRQCFYRQTG